MTGYNKSPRPRRGAAEKNYFVLQQQPSVAAESEDVYDKR